ncbi:MAG TPA: Asp23/Gls24 family envelope stress response protein [Clostridia bacterium]|jgi:uncharacterized alkaline shock family protein YloU|nr:Asp23/Gls24 family envelope stress response protein [Clostridia bacterium]
MPLKTNNVYGSITISDQAVSKIVGRLALDCYGVVAISPSMFAYRILGIGKKRKKLNRGIKITTMDNRVFINLYIVISKGINKDAVVDSLRSILLYNVSNLTGMRVKDVKIHVVGTV